MTSIGTYSEMLPCGGTLKVKKDSWEIQYYFSGPDLRYNGTFVNIPAARVDSYIDAFQKNWEEYEKLKTAIPHGGDFSKVGANGMSIQIGRFRNGVCLQSYHMCLKTKDEIVRVITSYRHAKERAKVIQTLLGGL
jgi:2-oxoglutarate dehydrogenase complex dehydrogenase (E1) component-like enzyme